MPGVCALFPTGYVGLFRWARGRKLSSRSFEEKGLTATPNVTRLSCMRCMAMTHRNKSVAARSVSHGEWPEAVVGLGSRAGC